MANVPSDQERITKLEYKVKKLEEAWDLLQKTGSFKPTLERGPPPSE
jgi:hypothetical protein